MDSARDEEGTRAIVSRATSPRAGRADRSCVLNMITPRRTVAFPPVRPPRQFRAAGQFGFACVSCPLARSDERESAPLLAPVSPGERLVGRNLRRIVRFLPQCRESAAENEITPETRREQSNNDLFQDPANGGYHPPVLLSTV